MITASEILDLNSESLTRDELTLIQDELYTNQLWFNTDYEVGLHPEYQTFQN